MFGKLDRLLELTELGILPTHQQFHVRLAQKKNKKTKMAKWPCPRPHLNLIKMLWRDFETGCSCLKNLQGGKMR